MIETASKSSSLIFINASGSYTKSGCVSKYLNFDDLWLSTKSYGHYISLRFYKDLPGYRSSTMMTQFEVGTRVHVTQVILVALLAGLRVSILQNRTCQKGATSLSESENTAGTPLS
jgi:hypothetical protein